MSKVTSTRELTFYSKPSQFHTKNGPLVGLVARLALRYDGMYLVKLTQDYILGKGENKKKVEKGTLLIVNEDFQNLCMGS